MNPRRTIATAGRVLRQVRHDPRTVVLLLVVPSLLIGLLSWIFSDTPVFNTLGPALIALFPFIVMFLITSITTLRERRTGTLERLLSMPLGKADLILGYTLAFSLLAILQSSIAVAFAVWVCGLTIEVTGKRFRANRVPGGAVHAGTGVPADPARRDLPAAGAASRRAPSDQRLASTVPRD
jgi:ABC-2 type transport system ATP-binding protein/ABC-2 type transport system permease protein